LVSSAYKRVVSASDVPPKELVWELVLSRKRAKFISGKAKFTVVCGRGPAKIITLDEIKLAGYRPKSNSRTRAKELLSRKRAATKQ
jgi:hypothetical protein